jgi:hypothetical protein
VEKIMEKVVKTVLCCTIGCLLLTSIILLFAVAFCRPDRETRAKNRLPVDAENVKVISNTNGIWLTFELDVGGKKRKFLIIDPDLREQAITELRD